MKLSAQQTRKCLELAGEADTNTRVRSKEEAEFQQEIVTLAQFFGWRVMWIRPVRVQRADGTIYYTTPIGANGKGWFDLTLVKDRIIFAEIKTDVGTLDPDQILWRDAVNAAGGTACVWRPADRAMIEAELRS